VYLKDLEMWCLGTWFSGGLGHVRLTDGLHDLQGLFQPKRFYDSMVLGNNCTDSLDIFVATQLQAVYDDVNVIQADGAQTPRWLTYGELEPTARQLDCQGKRFKAY